MHPAISDFPSLHFYDGQVTTGIRASDRPTPEGFPWPAASGPVAFVRVSESGGEREALVTAVVRSEMCLRAYDYFFSHVGDVHVYHIYFCFVNSGS